MKNHNGIRIAAIGWPVLMWPMEAKGNKMKQTDKMRELVATYGFDSEKVCAAYAQAEEIGEVPRKSNKNHISAELYALLLWKDGIRKGWLLR